VHKPHHHDKVADHGGAVQCTLQVKKQDTNIIQGDAETSLSCGEICSDHCTAKFLPSAPLKTLMPGF